MNIHRCLQKPRVVTPTETPGMVVSHTMVGDVNTYYETRLTPKEARTYAAQLILDADRAEAWEDMQARLASSAGGHRSAAIPSS